MKTAPKRDPGPQTARPRLDNLTLSRKEGLKRLVQAPARIPPECLSLAELKALSDAARAQYDRSRRLWHANLGPLRTPQSEELHEHLWDIIDSNNQDGDQAKGAIAIDALPGLGKTTSILAFVKKFYRREVAEDGEFTEGGHERWPVCRVGLSGNTSMKDFNQALLDFFGHPARSGTARELGVRALDCVVSCESKVMVVDDLHFLRWKNKNSVEVSNHFKYIANEFPVTLLFAGVKLSSRGLFSEGDDSYKNAVLAQTGRRTTRLTMKPFDIAEDAGRQQWRDLLLAVEQKVTLANRYQGMVADDLSDYLFARSTGHIGSLMTLINRGCQRAVRTGDERLTIPLLDEVKNDEASELARRELEKSLESGRLTSRPKAVRT